MIDHRLQVLTTDTSVLHTVAIAYDVKVLDAARTIR